MYLERVQLKNIRGAVALDVSLVRRRKTPAGWTVLAGKNGTGKTTLLQAAAATVLGPDNVLVMLDETHDFVRLGEMEGRSDVWLQGEPEDWHGEGDVRGTARLGVTWSRKAAPRKHPPRGNPAFVENQLWGGAAFGGESKGWFFAAYGAQRFASFPTAVAEKLMAAPPRRSAVVSLFRRDASLLATQTWVREVRQNSVFPAVNERRDRILATLAALLGDGILSEDGSTSAIRLAGEGVEILHPEGGIPIRLVGQGFESLALLVTDIVRQMVRFHGDNFRPSIDRNGRTIIEHSGVVLIDEMENHLHPQLQQRVGPWLKEHFPRVQFIVTTHSPFICQAADEGGLFRVTAPGAVEPVSGEVFRRVVNGSSDDAVLSELFGLEYPYSPHSRRLREELSEIDSQILSGRDLSPTTAQRRTELLAALPGDPKTEVDRLFEALRRRP